MTIAELLQERAQFDRKYWDKKGSTEEWLKHITYRLGKAIGKMAIYLEKVDHGAGPPYEEVLKEVAPDLIGFALQIKNRFPGDSCWMDVEPENDTELFAHQNDHSDTITPAGFPELIEDAYEDLLDAAKSVKDVLHLLEAWALDDVADRSASLENAYKNLFGAACSIASYFNAETEALYQARLAQLEEKFASGHF